MAQLDIASILGPDGSIARRIKNYEHRREQLTMADAVSSALANQKHLVVEAGTGVGKSFGYLVPAILFATQAEAVMDAKATNRELTSEREESPEDAPKVRRVIISTHTISLQEQLIAKDLPLLNAVIPREFSSVLVKGRGNYLSRRRLEVAKSRMTNLLSNEQDYEHMRNIERWAADTHDGTLSTLGFRPNGSVWDEVSSDSGNCMGRKCDHFEKCFYFAARRRIQNAQILVVNHALFFSDLAIRAIGGSILPDYDAVVFDECHTIEGVAGDHLGISISNNQVDYTLKKLYNPRTDKGVLVALKLRQLTKDCYACMESLDDLVADLRGWQENAPKNGRIREPISVQTTLNERLQSLSEQLERYGKDLKDNNARLDMMSASARLSALANSLDQWLFQKQSDSVYWLETQESRATGRVAPRMIMRSSPLDIGQHLRQHLFQKVPSVIMTSATLSTGKETGFSFFQRRIGAASAKSLQVGSPFDYKRLAELHLITDLPDPSDGRGEYEMAMVPILKHYIAMCDGHAFLLFTSYSSLKKTCEALTPWMVQHDLAVYSQADGTPRSELLRCFQANPRGVLFGAESFWQGVDVPGDALRLVVMTKLPFSVPDHPLLEARLEAIRSNGGNPFRDFQLPEAVIKFRQGFGRLIRTATDSGIVLVTDPRLSTKNYGKTFLTAVPECPQIFVSAKRFV